MFFVDAAHQSRSGRQNLIDEDENGLLRGELDTLADDVDELADGEICGHKVLLLVDSSDIRLLDLLTDHLCNVDESVKCQTGGESSSAAETTQEVPWKVRAQGNQKRFESWHTGMRSAYFWRIRSASALRFSKGCSSLNLDRMVITVAINDRRCTKEGAGCRDGGKCSA